MPKLKVPGENQKPRLHSKKLPGSKKLIFKDRLNKSTRDDKGKKSVLLGKRKNGTLRLSFSKTFGASDDEDCDWEGFTIEDIENEEQKKREGAPLENGLSMETDSLPFISPSSSSKRVHTLSHTPSHTPNDAPPLSEDHSPVRLLKRRRRCLECKACLRENDCGKCTNCLDKPKFGGPGSRKQACIHRKCLNLIREAATKSSQPNKRAQSSDSHAPPSKRPLREDGGGGPMLSSLRPRRLLPSSQNKTKDNQPVIQLYWPPADSIEYGYPVYTTSLSPSLPPSLPLCTRCGSLGSESFLYCRICCQSYHWFCANIPQATPTFTCHQCITCRVCGKPNKCVRCCECSEWYHEDCLLGHTSRPRTDNKQVWKCVWCTKCISCHSNMPNKIDDSGRFSLSSLLATPTQWSDGYCYCSDCIVLKAKGNSCPVCGECYLDNDFDSKMVQCSQCDNWVHSHCENMTDEEYEILSDLPDSVEYVCRLCIAYNRSVRDDKKRRREGEREEEEVEWRAAVNGFKQEAYEKMITSIKTALGPMWVNDVNVLTPLLSVNEFAVIMRDQLSKCSSGIKTGSHKHRLLFSSQQSYNKELEKMFPWFNIETSDAVKNEAPPTDTPTTDDITDIENWPSSVSHDHCYVSHDKKGTIKQEEKERKEEEEEERGRVGKDAPADDRFCLLCTLKGDQSSTDAGRLLPCGGMDEWVHVNCALWSAEVYEDTNGYLCSVHAAIGRGLRLKCDLCHLHGATVGCCHSSCSSNYHFMCARRKECRFLANKEVYCQQHSSLPATSDTVKDEDMRVDRCIIIHTDNDRPGRKFTKSFPPQNIQLRIGSLLIRSTGSLSPLSDTICPSLLIPHTFSSSSLFWSLTTPTQRITYTLTVSADLPKEEPLPLTTPTPETPPTSPSDLRWPCVSTQVSSDPDNEGVWSAVSAKSQILSSPSLINNNVTDKSNPEIALRIFRIPKKTRSSSSSPPPPTLAIGLTITTPLPVTSVHRPQSHKEEETVRPVLPLDSRALRQWEIGSPHSVNSVHYELKNEEGQSWRGPDLRVLWESVVSELQDARHKLDLPFVPFFPDNVYSQFGLSNHLVLQLLEQLPDHEKCSRHNFIYYQPEKISNWQQKRVIVNRTGCARSEGYNGIRSESDMFSFLMSQWRPDPPKPDLEALDMAVVQAECQGNSNTRHQPQNDVPVAMRYRACQRMYRESVGVFGSHIHGLGLFCLQEIDSGDMVIEYAGTVIRSTLTDYRERFYESKGIGCYMFRIDSDEVVDATMSGNMARFINHSCEPNCYSKVVAVDGQKKIMIFALRKIVPGEELTYDYKFPIEEAKIPCKCGSARCRKTLN